MELLLCARHGPVASAKLEARQVLQLLGLWLSALTHVLDVRQGCRTDSCGLFLQPHCEQPRPAQLKQRKASGTRPGDGLSLEAVAYLVLAAGASFPRSSARI